MSSQFEELLHDNTCGCDGSYKNCEYPVAFKKSSEPVLKAHRAEVGEVLRRLKEHECVMNNGDMIAHECIDAALANYQQETSNE